MRDPHRVNLFQKTPFLILNIIMREKSSFKGGNVIKRKILFSSYVDEERIVTTPKEIELRNIANHYRYLISIPFRNRIKQRIAVVIMKNPSEAGIFDNSINRRLSDDTIYNVCDYLYKHSFNFSKVIILNLFPIFGPNMKNLVNDKPNELLGEDLNSNKNNEVFSEVFNSLNHVPHRIILAWGGYPNLGNNLPKVVKAKFRKLYKDRINEVINIIGNRPTYKVGDSLSGSKFPAHGKVWYDFEPMKQFSHPIV
ncbi:DUF1643 domain-containing protein [Halobacillus mangrovi]|uniref:DUF1643 domain-containing protein n=1 Tax=Halobacillus mangrovi TaxID=402384 RepID=A0A1W5ZZY9_9BACI|nr:DUF1643 domain-containing protein [Halobacillus mangrovi]ARI78801.1 hypothetical protein HM131_19025 [Halobacillus mangrovi]